MVKCALEIFDYVNEIEFHRKCEKKYFGGDAVLLMLHVFFYLQRFHRIFGGDRNNCK
jgi:hypothetical protein